MRRASAALAGLLALGGCTLSRPTSDDEAAKREREEVQEAIARAHADERRQAGCERGEARACRELGLVQRETSPEQAAESFARACELKDGWSCATLGHALATRDPPDLEAAATYHRAACRLDVGEGCLNLARALELGRGVAADPEQAHREYARACELGVELACLHSN